MLFAIKVLYINDKWNGDLDKVKIMNEEKFSSQNKFSEFPNGSGTHDLPEYQLVTLTTELWRTHGKQCRKLGS